jgi:hypothetical protein
MRETPSVRKAFLDRHRNVQEKSPWRLERGNYMPGVTKSQVKKQFGCYIWLDSPFGALPGFWYAQYCSGRRIKLRPSEALIFSGKVPQIRKGMKDHGQVIVEMGSRITEGGEDFGSDVWVKVAGIMEDGDPGSVAVDCIRQIFAGGVANVSGMTIGGLDAGPALGYAEDLASIGTDAAGIGTNMTSGTGKVTRAMHWAFGDKVIVTVTGYMPDETSKYSNPRVRLPGPTVTWAALSEAVKGLAERRL